jgi:hypothetical protein
MPKNAILPYEFAPLTACQKHLKKLHLLRHTHATKKNVCTYNKFSIVASNRQGKASHV